MSGSCYWLVIGILGVWRLAHLLAAEDGPKQILVRLRKAAGEGFWGELLDCFYCLSLWVSAPLAVWFGSSAKERFGLWLAFSAGAILLERVRARIDETALPLYQETGVHDDAMLRKRTFGDDDSDSLRPRPQRVGGNGGTQ